MDHFNFNLKYQYSKIPTDKNITKSFRKIYIIFLSNNLTNFLIQMISNFDCMCRILFNSSFFFSGREMPFTGK